MSIVARARPHADVGTLLCEEAVEQLPVSGASLLVMTPQGSRARVAATGPLADALEEIEVVTGEGPSVDAFDLGRLVLVPDLAGRAGWPGFSRAALDAGVGAVFALPVQIGGIRLGVLELHHVAPVALSDLELTKTLEFLDAAALVLMHGDDIEEWAAPGRTAQMSGVEAEVHQATGMVSVQALVGLSEALLLLRGHAFAEGRTLLETARDVISRVLRFDPPGQGGS